MDFNPNILIPIVAIVLGLSLAITKVITAHRNHRRLLELHHIERMAAIERGIEVPPLPSELLTSTVTRGGDAARSTLLPGLMWLFVGIGALFFFGGFWDRGALIGLIPAGAGVAYLLYYFIEGRKEKKPNGSMPASH